MSIQHEAGGKRVHIECGVCFRVGRFIDRR